MWVKVRLSGSGIRLKILDALNHIERNHSPALAARASDDVLRIL
jgi:hypothetical protein